MKIEDGIVGLMKGGKKNNRYLKHPFIVTVGEINLWLEKKKPKALELMGILGMELLSKRVQIVKLKSHKEELMAKLGQVKLVLNFMQSIVVAIKKKLEVILAIEDRVIMIR